MVNCASGPDHGGCVAEGGLDATTPRPLRHNNMTCHHACRCGEEFSEFSAPRSLHSLPNLLLSRATREKRKQEVSRTIPLRYIRNQFKSQLTTRGQGLRSLAGQNLAQTHRIWPRRRPAIWAGRAGPTAGQNTTIDRSTWRPEEWPLRRVPFNPPRSHARTFALGFG
jgi:hypothetical protein